MAEILLDLPHQGNDNNLADRYERAMHFNVRESTAADLAGATAFFEENGYLPLAGLDGPIVDGLRRIVADTVGATDDAAMAALLAPDGEPIVFPREIRHRLSRIATPPELGGTLLRELEPIIAALIGPLVHVSSTFHGQFKGGVTQGVETYHNQNAADFMEVHGPWNLHQDFAGASLPTSPSGLTLWTPLNTCADWSLRFYPGSHRRGLFCHKLWKLDDPRLETFGRPVDFPARLGTGVLFNALMLHGTSNPGQGRRVSCDLRFFPLCGFLPSTVHVLGHRPVETLHRAAAVAAGPVLQSPLLEALVFLGEAAAPPTAPPYSALNWVQYLAHVVRGDRDGALPFLDRFINRALIDEDASVFIDKWHDCPIEAANLDRLRNSLLAHASVAGN
jgi:Phytanoyl-CoA dioxygenase (PhyH)